MVCARTAFTCGAARSEVTIGYVTWFSRMSGGWPAQEVWTTTCTSEMSGSASSGIRPRLQIPARVSNSTTMKTMKRLRAQALMIADSILHPPCGCDGGRLHCDDLAIALNGDGQLPGSA